jgi:hypothetical protein
MHPRKRHRAGEAVPALPIHQSPISEASHVQAANRMNAATVTMHLI